MCVLVYLSYYTVPWESKVGCALHVPAREQAATGVGGSPDQIPTPLRYPPRQTPHPPRLNKNCQMFAHAHYMVSLRSRKRQGSRGVPAKSRVHSAILLAKLLTLFIQREELSNVCACALHGLSQEQEETAVDGSPDQTWLHYAILLAKLLSLLV
jgi:hypothetical protein